MSLYSRRASEGGALTTFLIVGVVLAALVVGGIYTVSRNKNATHPAPAAPSKTAQPSHSASPSKSPQKVSPQTPKPTKTPSKSPAVTSTPRPTAAPQQPIDNHLPETGPTEDMLTISMLGCLVGVVIAYIRSTREWRLARQVD